MSAPGPHPNDDAPRPGGVEDQEQSSTFSVGRDPAFAETIVPTASEKHAGNHADSPLPAAFGRYRVIRLLGRGGMGSVYLGHDDQLDRAVAIKAPHAELFQTQEGRESFLREARTLAKLDHPRIIPIFDVGETSEGQCYVVCKFIEGQTLKDRMRDVRFSPREASNLMAEVADALHHAHKQGFVHRDIKPSNILIDREGNPWIADFGLAVTETAQRRLAGEVSGTPAYMSPEQARGEVQYLDGRADIWSVGVILYELLSGRRPFGGGSIDELFAEIARKEPRPLRMIDETIPQSLERVVLRCLRRPVAERHSTAHDLARDLRRWGRKPARPMIVVVLASTLSIAALASVVPQFWRPANDRLLTESTDGAPADRVSDREAELALLIEELRGLRRDLGESNARIDALAGGRDAVVESPLLDQGPLAIHGQVETTESLPREVVPYSSEPGPLENLPDAAPTPEEWMLMPLPVEFAEIEQQLRSAREAGDENAEDGLLLDATNQLIEYGYYADAEHLAFRMVELAESDSSDASIANGQLGLAQFQLGKFDEALTSYQLALEGYQTLYDQMLALPESDQALEPLSEMASQLGLTLMHIGDVHKAADDYQLARDAYDSSREILELHDRKDELVTLYLSYGGLESAHGNYETAIQLLQEGLSIAETTTETDEQAEMLVNLGNAYAWCGDNGAAVHQYELAAECAKLESNYEFRSALLINWSTSLLEKGEYEQARELLHELESFARPDDVGSQRALELLPALDRFLTSS